jgi:two-component system, LytTR family, response regulator
MKLKALIADDEPLARERLRFLLGDDPEIEIAGECRNVAEVVAHIKSNPIDLLFLDIQMPGMTGFAVFEKLGRAQLPLTVFVTGYNQYAVKAFEVNALDYLIKPIEPERLRATLARAKQQLSSKAALTTRETLVSVLATLGDKGSLGKSYPQRLLVPNGAKEHFVAVNEIDWIEAADYYACLHVGPRSFLLRETVKELASRLDPKRFVRIHRSIIVNGERVREILREGRGEGSVVLANGVRLRMSKVGWQRLLTFGREE